MTEVLVVTKGHPFEPEPFFAMWDALDGVTWRHAEHPDADRLLDPATLNTLGVKVVCLYDMPGLAFRLGEGVELVSPPPEVVAAWKALLAAGVPVLALHHAIAGWPAWPDYADVLGGRFHYAPAELHGRAYPDSGYRHDVRQHLHVVDPSHPVTAGLPPRFEIVDETYLCPVFDDEVTPLLATDAPRTDQDHYSAGLAVHGARFSREGWTHPPGSALAAWTKRSGASTVVYIQPGDGPSVYGHAAYRRLLSNAIGWLASTAPATSATD